MQMNRNRIRYAGYVALLSLLALGMLQSGSPTNAQETSPDPGDITFVRLANGEPGGEGIYIINADGTGERPLFLFEDLSLPYNLLNGGYRCPVWSPDGTQLAFNGTDGELTNYLAVVDVETGDVEFAYEVQHDDQMLQGVFYPEWTPDASALSFGFTEVERNTGILRASGVRTVNLDDGEVSTLRDDLEVTEADGSARYMGGPMPNYYPFSHSWSPDGSQLALVFYNWRAYVLDAAGTTLQEIPAQWANGDVEWSPDGSTLAISLYRALLVDPASEAEREIVPMGETLNGSTVESLAWSPDGSKIAYSTMWIDISSGEFTTAFSLSVVDAETSEIRELIRTPWFTGSEYPHNISCVDWRPSADTAQ